MALIIGAAGWIASGELTPHAQEAPKPADSGETAVQKVGVQAVTAEQHANASLISCVTRADHRAFAVARGAGLIEELKVARGQRVETGDPIATISDEGRQAALAQAEALLAQRQAEYDANKRLIESGNSPRNNLPVIEAALAAAKASLAAAQAEAERTSVTAPWPGVIEDVPVQRGQAVQIGTQIAEIVGPDPMLAVGAVTERLRTSMRVGQEAEVRFIDGSKAKGTVSFVGLAANTQTRTYPVEIKVPNADGRIPDGVTCELSVMLDPVEATAVPRSALVFSDEGKLGVRIIDGNVARFVPVGIVEDQPTTVWVSGLTGTTQLIVSGQDFVTDGDTVEVIKTDDTNAKPEPAA